MAELLGELNYSGYQQLGFDKVLLVEGPSEVKTVQQFLRQCRKDHEVVLLPMSGSSLIRPGVELELQEVKRISPNVRALIDSERTAPGAALDATRQGFLQACQNVQIPCHVLDRRATENYLTDRAVKAVMGPTFRSLGPFDQLRTAGNAWGKADNWRIAREMQLPELAGTDLGNFLAAL